MHCATCFFHLPPNFTSFVFPVFFNHITACRRCSSEKPGSRIHSHISLSPTSLRLFSLSSSITSLPVGDVLQKNREVEFIRTSLCPLTSLRLFSLSSSITSLPIGDVLQKNREVEFPLPSVFEDDVTVVTKIEKHRGIYIARNELCEGVHSENQVMRSRIYIFPFNSLSLIILARISSKTFVVFSNTSSFEYRIILRP